jgi:hypothetical protein
MYLYVTFSISYGVDMHWDLQNANKFKFKTHNVISNGLPLCANAWNISL